MAYNLLFDDKVIKDLRKIDFKWRKIIIDNIKNKLVNNPYSGKKLLGEISNYYRLRVGNYRIIYEIFAEDSTIVVIKIKHRKNVYRK